MARRGPAPCTHRALPGRINRHIVAVGNPWIIAPGKLLKRKRANRKEGGKTVVTLLSDRVHFDASSFVSLLDAKPGIFIRNSLILIGYRKKLKGAPGGIRTHDRRIRNPLLYPTELRVQVVDHACLRPL